eukprot:g746.t1
MSDVPSIDDNNIYHQPLVPNDNRHGTSRSHHLPSYPAAGGQPNASIHPSRNVVQGGGGGGTMNTNVPQSYLHRMAVNNQQGVPPPVPHAYGRNNMITHHRDHYQSTGHHNPNTHPTGMYHWPPTTNQGPHARGPMPPGAHPSSRIHSQQQHASQRHPGSSSTSAPSVPQQRNYHQEQQMQRQPPRPPPQQPQQHSSHKPLTDSEWKQKIAVAKKLIGTVVEYYSKTCKDKIKTLTKEEKKLIKAKKKLEKSKEASSASVVTLLARQDAELRRIVQTKVNLEKMILQLSKLMKNFAHNYKKMRTNNMLRALIQITGEKDFIQQYFQLYSSDYLKRQDAAYKKKMNTAKYKKSKVKKKVELTFKETLTITGRAVDFAYKELVKMRTKANNLKRNKSGGGKSKKSDNQSTTGGGTVSRKRKNSSSSEGTTKPSAKRRKASNTVGGSSSENSHNADGGDIEDQLKQLIANNSQQQNQTSSSSTTGGGAAVGSLRGKTGAMLQQNRNKLSSSSSNTTKGSNNSSSSGSSKSSGKGGHSSSTGIDKYSFERLRSLTNQERELNAKIESLVKEHIGKAENRKVLPDHTRFLMNTRGGSGSSALNQLAGVGGTTTAKSSSTAAANIRSSSGLPNHTSISKLNSSINQVGDVLSGVINIASESLQLLGVLDRTKKRNEENGTESANTSTLGGEKKGLGGEKSGRGGGNEKTKDTNKSARTETTNTSTSTTVNRSTSDEGKQKDEQLELDFDAVLKNASTTN